MPSLPVRTLTTLLPLAGAALLVACGEDAPPRTEAAYCTEVGNRLADLNAPVLATEADVEAVLDSWREVSARAPLAVQQEWETVVRSMETAATVNAADAASVQQMTETARAAEPAATKVILYTYERCKATIGGVTPAPTTPAQITPTTDG